MKNVFLKKKTIDDLSQIWDYTLNNWSEKQANKYYNLIKSACFDLGKNPNKANLLKI